jgi:hypothetical protein
MSKKMLETIIKDDSESNESENLKSDKKELDVSLAPKRRGRPKKIITEKKILSKISSKKYDDDEILEDELILHLPLYDDDDSSSEKNIFTMKDDSDQLNNKIKTLTHSEETDESEHSGFSMKKLLVELKKKDIIIRKLKSELNRTDFNEVVSIIPNDSKIKKVNLNLIDIKDNKSIVVEKTSIACWWCTYTFDTLPCFIPDRYYSDKFYVFGCFCTYSCALSYNLDMNDYRVNLRNSLIKEMYTKVTGLSDNIPLAPKRELLKKYGGILSIDEFRSKLLLMKKEFKIKFPPSIPLLISIEEVDTDNNTKKTLLRNK